MQDAITVEPVFGAIDHPHFMVPGEPLQTKQRSMFGQAGNGNWLLRPLSELVVKPQVGDVPADGMHGGAHLTHALPEPQALGDAVVDDHLVEDPARKFVGGSGRSGGRPDMAVADWTPGSARTSSSNR